MSFVDTLGKFVDPVGVVSGFLGGKGALGGVGESLFGKAGDIGYQATPPPSVKGQITSPVTVYDLFGVGSNLTPDLGVQRVEYPYLDPRDFKSRDSGRSKAMSELDRERPEAPMATAAPAVTPPSFTPEAYGGATLDRGGFDEQMGGYRGSQRDIANARQRQLRSLSLLQNAALGRAPSVAESQLRAGSERAIAAQAAAAASARGGAGARAAARRQAAFQGAETMAETNRQAAELRAAEMAQARGEYAAGTQALRAGDISAGGLQLSGAQTALQPALAQAELAQQAGLQTQALGTQAGMQTQALGTQAGLQNQTLGTQVALANQAAQLQNMGLTNQYNLGLMGRLTDMDKIRLMGTMGYSGMAQEQAAAQNQEAYNYWKAQNDYAAGVAGQNAQAELIRSSGGLGFLSGMMGGIGSMAAAA